MKSRYELVASPSASAGPIELGRGCASPSIARPFIGWPFIGWPFIGWPLIARSFAEVRPSEGAWRGEGMGSLVGDARSRRTGARC
jgi:hypothetical protein